MSGSTRNCRLAECLDLKSQELLATHPVNQKRLAEGKDAANSIWPWSPGYRPKMEPLSQKYPSIHRGSVITAVDLIRGIGRYAGLRCIDVEGATGLYNTNYEGKAQAAIEALKLMTLFTCISRLVMRPDMKEI